MPGSVARQGKCVDEPLSRKLPGWRKVLENKPILEQTSPETLWSIRDGAKVQTQTSVGRSLVSASPSMAGNLVRHNLDHRGLSSFLAGLRRIPVDRIGQALTCSLPSSNGRVTNLRVCLQIWW